MHLDGNIALTALERQIFDKALQGEDPLLRELRGQLDHLEVIGRTHTGVGFFTTVTVAHEYASSSLHGATFRIDDVEAQVRDLERGAGLLILVRDGLLRQCEAYTYGEPWHEPYSVAELRYTHEPQRLPWATKR